jgi:hypothetical protein
VAVAVTAPAQPALLSLIIIMPTFSSAVICDTRSLMRSSTDRRQSSYLSSLPLAFRSLNCLPSTLIALLARAAITGCTSSVVLSLLPPQALKSAAITALATAVLRALRHLLHIFLQALLSNPRQT